MPEHILDHISLNSAFQRVKENHGSPGVDGVTIERYEVDLQGNLAALASELRKASYAPLPLLKILVDKGNGEARDLSIPAVRDRVAQVAVLEVIEPILDKEFADCSFGYRKGRSVRQAVYRIRDYFEQGFRWVAEADIDSFFDNVDHGLLMRKLEKCITDMDIRRLIRLWITGEVWDGKAVRAMDRGIPQGSPVSPVLANLFLDELDDTLLEKGCRLIRYADDFIIMCKTPDKATEALEFTEAILDKLLLKLDEEEVVSFDQGFKFLGVVFVKSLIMVPFEKEKKERKVLYYPPPLDMDVYNLKKMKGW